MLIEARLRSANVFFCLFSLMLYNDHLSFCVICLVMRTPILCLFLMVHVLASLTVPLFGDVHTAGCCNHWQFTTSRHFCAVTMRPVQALLRVCYDCHKKQQLFLYTALSRSYFRGRNVFPMSKKLNFFMRPVVISCYKIYGKIRTCIEFKCHQCL